MSNELAVLQDKPISIFDADQFKHWLSVSEHLSKSTMIPKNYMGKPMDIMVAIEMGQQVGLSMMQALQSIAVINGMPCIFGDAPLAICQSHPNFEWINEEPIIRNDSVFGYKCTVKRFNRDEHTVIFTKDDAKRAGLLGKAGPWTQYESRMLQMRARGFALRNTFPDALKGIKIKEEVEDMQVIDAVWETKQTQQEKMQSLLTKKGFNNESKSSNNEDIGNNPNPANIDPDIMVFNSDTNLKQTITHADGCGDVAQTTESAIVPENKEAANAKCTKEQLGSIEFKMEFAGFDDARRLKALKHFGVSTFPELTAEQADELIKIIEKA